MKKMIFLMSLPVFLASGCATIFSPSHDPVTISSVPEGSAVFMDGNRVGKTPVTIQVKRQLTAPRVEVKNDGYYPQGVILQNQLNGVSLLNIFFWPGFIVDAATGSLMKASQFNYQVELEPKDSVTKH